MADTIPEVLQAFARGELVVVTDDDDREGEGDLIVAASLCTAEKMAFIIRHTSGIVCAPITMEDARRLRLDPMVIGAQTMPEVWRMMNAIFSAVQSDATTIRSPSPSRSSSSVTTTSSPLAKACRTSWSESAIFPISRQK